jgi:hypothetical protein
LNGLFELSRFYGKRVVKARPPFGGNAQIIIFKAIFVELKGYFTALFTRWEMAVSNS